jgi:hypothetical protein
LNYIYFGSSAHSVQGTPSKNSYPSDNKDLGFVRVNQERARHRPARHDPASDALNLAYRGLALGGYTESAEEPI